jgi:hypothetical protein
MHMSAGNFIDAVVTEALTFVLALALALAIVLGAALFGGGHD